MTTQFELFIGGLPLYHFPEPPADQIDCKVMKCNVCNEDMWISKRKRIKINKTKAIKVWCYPCIAKWTIENNLSNTDVHFRDINREN